MIILNNNYEVLKVIKGSSDIFKNLEYDKILSDNKSLYKICFRSDKRVLEIFYSDKLGVLDVKSFISKGAEKIQEDCPSLSKDLKTIYFDIQDVEGDLPETLGITVSYFDEDTIESNFLEDNGREMNKEDWERMNELISKLEYYLVFDKLEKILGAHIVWSHGGNSDLDLEFGNVLTKDEDKMKELVKIVGTSILDSHSDKDYHDNFNIIQTYELDVLGNYERDKGPLDQKYKDLCDPINGFRLYIPKGHPLYYFMGGK